MIWCGGSGVDKPERTSQTDDALQRIRTELHDLLGRSPSARDVLSHLAGVERALKTLGVAAFESLPSYILKRAMTQLESVLPEPVGPGIADLRARLARALAGHDAVQAPAVPPAAGPAVPPVVPPAHQPASFSNDQLQVSEATVTDFDRVVAASQRRF